MTEGSATEQFSTWIANWQVTARKNETGLSPVHSKFPSVVQTPKKG